MEPPSLSVVSKIPLLYVILTGKEIEISGIMCKIPIKIGNKQITTG